MSTSYKFTAKAQTDGIGNVDTEAGEGVHYVVTPPAPTTTRTLAYLLQHGYVAASGGTPPTVGVQSPANAATGVSAAVAPTITFSESMHASSIDSTTVKLLDATNDEVEVAVTLNEAGTVATLTPAEALTAGAVYRLRVTVGATDASGNPIASQFTQAAGFTVAP